MGCHTLLQGIFLTQGSNLCLLSPELADGFFTTSSTWEAFIFFSPFGHAAQLMKSYFPDQRSNLPPAMKVPSPNPWTGREFPI